MTHLPQHDEESALMTIVRFQLGGSIRQDGRGIIETTTVARAVIQTLKITDQRAEVTRQTSPVINTRDFRALIRYLQRLKHESPTESWSQ